MSTRDFFELAKVIYLNHEKYSREFRTDSFFEEVKEYDLKKYDEVKKLSSLSIPDDIYLFKVAFVFNPYMTFRFKGFIFDDYQKLGKTMLNYSPNPNPILIQALRYSLFSEHMEAQAFDSESREMYSKTKQIEKLVERNAPLAYYTLGYYLSKNTTITYDGVIYKDVFNFCYYLCKKERNLDTLGANLAKSPLLTAYLQNAKEKNKIDIFLHLAAKNQETENELLKFLESRKKS